MKFLIPTQFLVVLALLAVGCSHSHKSHHDHGNHDHHHHHTDAKLELNNGKKWETDESLRKGMTEIKKIATTNLSKVSTNTVDAKGFTNIATKVDGQIHYLIKNCKLPDDADAQLHVLIAQMVGAAHKMKDSAEISEKKEGFTSIVEAVNTYGDFFNHPGWTKIDVK